MQNHIATMVEDFERGVLTRRQLVAGLTALATAGLGVRAFGLPIQDTSAMAAKPTFTATGLNHIALAVTDVARSRTFYEKHLGMKVTGSASESSCFMSCQRDWIALFKRDNPGMHHYCYSIDNYTADSAVKTLESAGLTPKRRGNRVYFDDPDGIEVQVAAA